MIIVYVKEWEKDIIKRRNKKSKYGKLQTKSSGGNTGWAHPKRGLRVFVINKILILPEGWRKEGKMFGVVFALVIGLVIYNLVCDPKNPDDHS